MEHTQGKLTAWTVGYKAFIGTQLSPVAEVRQKEDAARLCATWNACEGLGTEFLDELKGEEPLQTLLLYQRATIVTLTAALENIAEGAGPYSRDPFEHAANCVDAMKETAMAVLKEVQ